MRIRSGVMNVRLEPAWTIQPSSDVPSSFRYVVGATAVARYRRVQNPRRRYARRVSNQSEGQASSPWEPQPWAGQPAPSANPGPQSGAPWNPYPTYQRPEVPDHSRDRHSGEPTSVIGLVLTLVGLAVAFVMWLGVGMLTLVPTLILMTMALLLAVVGAIFLGRAVARGMGRPRDVLGLLAAGAAAAISVTFLLWMTDPVEREFYTCWYGADTLEQANACDVAHNTSLWQAPR